jgi:hypothetical protein
MDWQIDRAIELGIITESQATEEMQSKLESFEEDCIKNESFVRSLYSDCYPKTVLESEHKNSIKNISEQKDAEIKRLESKISDYEYTIRQQRYRLEDYYEKYGSL